MPLDLFELLIVVMGLGVGAFVKGVTGTGLPLVAVPVISIFLGLEHAVVAVQIPNIVSNILLIGGHRKHLTSISMRWNIVVPSVVSIIIGVLFLKMADKITTEIFLAVILGLFLLFLGFKPNFQLKGFTSRILSPVVSVIGGFTHGATGVSGPIYGALLYSLRLKKEEFVLYNGVIYGIFNTVQLLAFIGLGMFYFDYLIQGTLALVPVIIAQYFGMKASRLLSLLTFNRIILGLLFIIEAKLVWGIVEKWT